jgi:catalase (peroxidase I)
MRLPIEQADPENAGLGRARQLLAGVHQKHPWMSWADLHVLAGNVAIEHSGGPAIPFSAGRSDFTNQEARAVHGRSGCPFGDGKHNPNGSRLPAADLGPDESAPKSDPTKREAATIAAMRGTFHRMGFNDKESVCLVLLGHQYGRCHEENSGEWGASNGLPRAIIPSVIH